MYVNSSAFSEVLRDLRGAGSIALPVEVVPAFIAFCNKSGFFPAPGRTVGTPDGDIKFLYHRSNISYYLGLLQDLKKDKTVEIETCNIYSFTAFCARHGLKPRQGSTVDGWCSLYL